MDEMVKVAVIGTGDGGIQPGVAVTSGDAKNVFIDVIRPITAILVRLANNYLISLLAFVTAGITSDLIPYDDFAALVLTSAKLSIAPTALALAKDLITILGKLEQKYPLATGSV